MSSVAWSFLGVGVSMHVDASAGHPGRYSLHPSSRSHAPMPDQHQIRELLQAAVLSIKPTGAKVRLPRVAMSAAPSGFLDRIRRLTMASTATNRSGRRIASLDWIEGVESEPEGPLSLPPHARVLDPSRTHFPQSCTTRATRLGGLDCGRALVQSSANLRRREPGAGCCPSPPAARLMMPGRASIACDEVGRRHLDLGLGTM